MENITKDIQNVSNEIIKIAIQNNFGIDNINWLLEQIKKDIYSRARIQPIKEYFSDTLEKMNNELNNVKNKEEKVKTAVVSLKLGDTEEKLENLKKLLEETRKAAQEVRNLFK